MKKQDEVRSKADASGRIIRNNRSILRDLEKAVAPSSTMDEELVESLVCELNRSVAGTKVFLDWLQNMLPACEWRGTNSHAVRYAVSEVCDKSSGWLMTELWTWVYGFKPTVAVTSRVREIIATLAGRHCIATWLEMWLRQARVAWVS